MNRRDFLKIVVSIPVLGALALFVSPLFRYLRPSSGPLKETRISTEGNVLEWQGDGGLFSKPDEPRAKREVVFKLSDFPKEWDCLPFTYEQESKEYTFRHFQASMIPGYVVRLPGLDKGQPRFLVVNRICPHMGCVFNYLKEPAEAVAYNYPGATNPLFGCPCHLSVYDPLQTQDVEGKQIPGRVVSGPAPRPPRLFMYEIRGDMLAITSLEAGGIA